MSQPAVLKPCPLLARLAVAVGAAVSDALKKPEKNVCSWHSSCNVNLKTLPLGVNKTL